MSPLFCVLQVYGLQAAYELRTRNPFSSRYLVSPLIFEIPTHYKEKRDLEAPTCLYIFALFMFLETDATGAAPEGHTRY